jgi:hypothetical protein
VHCAEACIENKGDYFQQLKQLFVTIVHSVRKGFVTAMLMLFSLQDQLRALKAFHISVTKEFRRHMHYSFSTQFSA